MGWLLPLLLAFHSSVSPPEVFSQLGIDGSPVRWEASIIVLSVSRPPVARHSIGHDRLVALAHHAAQIFDGQLGVELRVTKLVRKPRQTQEDGVNEVVLRSYRPCHPVHDVLDHSQCNDENRYAHTRIYPATRQPGQTYRTIVEGDIEINISEFGNLNTERGQQHLVAILRHEIGHLLGLAHNCVSSKLAQSRYKGDEKPPICDLGNRSHVSALMYPHTPRGVLSAFRPNGAEWAFLKKLYPIRETSTIRLRTVWALLAVLTLASLISLALLYFIRRRRGTTGSDHAN